jgi:type I restriction enzyme R subunit
VFALIQKFNKKVNPQNPYSERGDIVVITARSAPNVIWHLAIQYAQCFVQCQLIGFTGTQLFKDDEIPKKVFDDYMATYDFQRAVEDKATVSLYYDTRGEELVFTDEEGNEHTVQRH